MGRKNTYQVAHDNLAITGKRGALTTGLLGRGGTGSLATLLDTTNGGGRRRVATGGASLGTTASASAARGEELVEALVKLARHVC